MFGIGHEVKAVQAADGVEIWVSGQKVLSFSNVDKKCHLYQIDGLLTGLLTDGLTVVTQVG